MIAVEFSSECAICFERPSERLFEQDAETRPDERGRVLAMVFCRRDDHRGVADTRLGQCIDGRKNRHIKFYLSKKAAHALAVRLSQGYKLTPLRIAGEFVRVKGVNRPHAAEPGNRKFKRFDH